MRGGCSGRCDWWVLGACEWATVIVCGDSVVAEVILDDYSVVGLYGVAAVLCVGCVVGGGGCVLVAGCGAALVIGVELGVVETGVVLDDYSVVCLYCCTFVVCVGDDSV